MNRAFRSVATMSAVCAALVFLPAGGATASSASTDPPGTIRVGPTAPSTEDDVDEPVAGSSTFLAYTRVVQLAGRDLHAPPPTDEATRMLFARSASGATVALGAVSLSYEDYSLVGSTLVADLPIAGGRETVYWWDAATAAAGSITLAQGDHLISAAPDGFVYADGPHLFQESVSGTVTDLATPFPDDPTIRGVAGDGGLVVVAGRNDIAYLTFGTPSHVTTLHADTKLGLDCEAVDDHYAGCVGEGGDEENTPRRVLLIPLSGGAPTTSDTNPGDVAISGSTLLWKGVEGTGTGAHNVLLSLRAGSSKTTVSSTGLGSADGPAFVSAYGDGVGVTPSADRIVSVTSASSPATTIVKKVASPVSASTFALTAGRIAYIADERVTGSSRRLSAFSASVSNAGGVLSSSSPAVVHAGAYYDTVGASGSVTAYETRPQSDSVTLDVAVGSHTHRITHVFRYGHPTVAGKRVLYLKSGERDGRATSTYYVYDVADHKTTKVYTDPTQCCEDQPALAGHELAYVKSNGSVWRKNLDTGMTVRLAKARKSTQYATIYAVGDHVAWEIVYLTTRANGDVVQKEADVSWDARTASAPVKLPSDSLVGLSARGVILGHFPHSDKGLASSSYRLQTFGGSTVQLLPRQAVDAYPQIAGSMMAWIDSTGTLKAAPVPG